MFSLPHNELVKIAKVVLKRVSAIDVAKAENKK